MAENTGNSSKKNKESASAGEDDKIFMQLLRSQRYTLQQIANITGFCPATIRKYTEKKYFPPGTNLNLILVVRQLTMKEGLDAAKDQGANATEHAGVIQKYTDAILKLENLKDSCELRDKILSLEWLMQEEGLSQKTLDEIQAKYDKLNEELKG